MPLTTWPLWSAVYINTTSFTHPCEMRFMKTKHLHYTCTAKGLRFILQNDWGGARSKIFRNTALSDQLSDYRLLKNYYAPCELSDPWALKYTKPTNSALNNRLIYFVYRCSDWLRVGRRKSQSSSPGGVKKFHFLVSSRPALGPT
jgi:hypothetical protein